MAALQTLQVKLLLALLLILGGLFWYVRATDHAADPKPHEARPPAATLDGDDVVKAMKDGPASVAPGQTNTETAPRRKPRHETNLDPNDAYGAMKDGYSFTPPPRKHRKQ